jgi:tetratricopeptide (TPR) repeat protein
MEMTEHREEATEAQAEELFQRALVRLEKGNAVEALALFERSYELRKSALCLSYLGLLNAQERGRHREGITMCTLALEKETENPTVYLNLGKALYKAERKKEALSTVRKGLAYGNDPEALRWLDRVGVRRGLVLPFLPRNNVVNRYLGLVFTRLGLR